jgi:hypothetical protein|tara:strand:- start:1102 stop:1254 length:153 start_codon:yes stop_codon:yes gene_type:complete
MKRKDHRYNLVTKRVAPPRRRISAEHRQMIWDTVALLILTAIAITAFILI